MRHIWYSCRCSKAVDHLLITAKLLLLSSICWCWWCWKSEWRRDRWIYLQPRLLSGNKLRNERARRLCLLRLLSCTLRCVVLLKHLWLHKVFITSKLNYSKQRTSLRQQLGLSLNHSIPIHIHSELNLERITAYWYRFCADADRSGCELAGTNGV